MHLPLTPELKFAYSASSTSTHFDLANQYQLSGGDAEVAQTTRPIR